MDRVILHCDCNSFFASVELLYLPELRHQPVAVCGSPDDRHGIVLAKNELAKRYGIQTAETAWQARRKCPTVVFVPPHRELYTKFSRQINAIYQRYSDLVEPFSIDESFIDITGTKHLFGGDEVAIADEIRRRVQAETGLTISVGVSFNKTFAKMGSDYKKPNATTHITRENYQEILWPLPVGDLIYVGRAAQEVLARVGIRTIGQLAQADPMLLEQLLGKGGISAWNHARGQDDDPVLPADQQREVKSVGNGQTFRRNLVGGADLRAGITALADSVAMRLRAQKLYCTGVQLTIKNTELKSIQRQCTLPRETCLAKDISDAAYRLLLDNWDLTQPVRMLTVTAIGLTSGAGMQLNFLEDTTRLRRQENLEEALFAIREKYGHHAIGRGNVVNNDIGLTELAIDPEDDEPPP